MFSIFDYQMMQRALELAERGIYTTTPNPNVGCVITQDNKIVGEGFHYRAGEPHAEVHALRAARERAAGAIVYVTLEPCSHVGRTPPCSDALIEARVNRVVCAMVDPNPEVSGCGIQCLRDAGIQVDVGLRQVQAEKLNLGFIKVMQTGLPYVQLKLASSLDGRTALSNGQSKWITGTEARADVQKFRAKTGAILSTSKTVLEDDPSLNVRWKLLPVEVQSQYDEASLRQPVRVILDRKCSIPTSSHLFTLPGHIIILTSKNEPSTRNYLISQRERFFEKDNVEVMTVSNVEKGLDLNMAMQMLARKGINHIWVEAGATFSGSLLEADLVDELIMYQAPKLMGVDSRGLVNISGFTAMEQVLTFTLTDVHRLGNDIRIRMQRP
ncbi:bifunctional diaminohydroxyphosphoribosylaminopyrimidine deaminase/5-amino-6-(5-phosphoribosylamino)uracil reductase RibD [Candidatus Enterovibrio escicola]|uniref:bifunctional diaminohydroxyphosphoribosylaminopyrimidine deaminase/5-amino-6-(5-phosphoribosylamino)uracil reductase RibD n=1 Tax=Candidatus Enterovibrio escicola TaxID=1927127 RepID=UPI001237A18F|nr:bifunctional diaminohydroxyphosphoribosylaminopyrimidine deaminase/5-amino-6-(5-phosphoribosylamino)uracil reductase RibD [Candidatus Enterovibrio escacola]